MPLPSLKFSSSFHLTQNIIHALIKAPETWHDLVPTHLSGLLILSPPAHWHSLLASEFAAAVPFWNILRLPDFHTWAPTYPATPLQTHTNTYTLSLSLHLSSTQDSPEQSSPGEALSAPPT